MPLPPKGDPRRPMYSAVRAMRVLGILLCLFGGLGLISVLRTMFGGRAPIPRAPMMILSTLIGSLFYVGPGILLLVFAQNITRRKAWALIASIVLVSVMLLFLLLVPVIIMIIAMTDRWSPFMLIPISIAAIFILALAQLIYLLSKSFKALMYYAPEESRGFEPVGVNQLTVSDQQSS
jgi:hypothetical protein